MRRAHAAPPATFLSRHPRPAPSPFPKPTRPKQTEQDLLADARHVLAKITANRAAFTAADKGKTKKILEPSLLTRLADNIALCAAAIGGQSTGKSAVRTATSREVAARAALFDAITAIRDDVKLSYADDPAMGKAFGVGLALSRASTPKLLAAASVIADAYQVPEQKDAAKAACVTPARMQGLAKLAETLSSADTVQNTGMAGRKGGTISKDALLRAIKADVAHLREAAKRVFRGQKEVLAQFKSTIVRRVAKKRAPKAAPKAEPSLA